MVTKNEASGVKINWEEINKLTEIPRTYLVRDKFGNEFYKMYKPQQAKEIFKKKGWTGQIVSTLDRSGDHGSAGARRNRYQRDIGNHMDRSWLRPVSEMEG